MRIKLDENFDVRLVPLLAAQGHEVDTVPSEGLSGTDDDGIYAVCRANGRVLITFDMDFSNPFRFPPDDTEGIIVVRVPRPVLPVIQKTLASVLPLLKSQAIKGMLWIVEPGRIRIHDPHDNEGEDAGE
jgi:predicted nuclease of predicted toxin-antitoxin system